METNIIEYKCPCCNAGLHFSGESQQLKCEFCDNTFELDAVKAYNASIAESVPETIEWEQAPQTQWQTEESVRAYQCPSCGGEILTDDNTAATFCPYCENPTILPGRLSGGLKPDFVLPFKTGKEDAKAAFLKAARWSTPI